jgi:hypothetical protein
VELYGGGAGGEEEVAAAIKRIATSIEMSAIRLNEFLK